MNRKHLTYLFSLLFCLFFIQSQLLAQSIAKTDSLRQWIKEHPEKELEILNKIAFDLLKTNYDSSKLLADSAYKLSYKQKQYKQVVKSLVTMGIAHYYSGSYDQAMKHYMEALELGDSIGDPASQVLALNEMGVLTRKMGDLPKAENTFAKAVQLSKEAKDSSLMANSMNNLGVTYDLQEQHEKAMAIYEESAEIKRRLGDIYGLTFNLDNMGQTHSKMGNFEKGEAHFLEAARLRQELGDQTGYAITINNIGELYLMKGDQKTALKYFMQSLTAAEKLDYKEFKNHLYKMLSDAHLALGDPSKAFEYLTKSMVLKDSIYNEQRNKQILELQAKYETEKKEKELQLLKAESELQTIQIEQARNLTISVVLLSAFLFLGILLYSSRKHYKLKARLAIEKEQLQKTRFKAVIDAEEKERKRIARELHDGLGQLLSTARLTVSSLDEEREDPKIRNSVKLIDTAVQEVRNISHNMMPNALTAYGLEAALDDLVRKLNQSGKLQVHMKKDVSMQVDESKSVAVYRVVQEIFNNTIKYAEAKVIDFSISESGTGFAITIRDDGKGFDTTAIQSSTGIGWSNIYSRMELIGGQINVYSKINEGTTVKLFVPSDFKEKSIAS